MIVKRTISTAVILSLLLALLLPVGTQAHGCHGDDAALQAMAQAHGRHDNSDDPHLHGNSGHHHDGTHDHEKAHSHDHYNTSHATSTTTVAGSDGTFTLQHPFFCCTENRQVVTERIDVARLPAQLQLALVLATTVASSMLPLDALAGPCIINRYKIGSSPPGVVASERYIYLHISTLLV